MRPGFQTAGISLLIILMGGSVSYSLTAPQAAYSYPTSIEEIGLRWTNLNLGICISNTADRKYQELFMDAVDKWKEVWPHFSYQIGGAGSCHINVHILNDYADYQDAGFLGTMQPTTRYNSEGGYWEFASAKIIIPTKNKHLVIEKGYCCRNVFLERTEKQFYQTSLHEFGHALGLKHSQDSGSGPLDIMDAVGYPDAEYIISSLILKKLNEIYGTFGGAKDHPVELKPSVTIEAEIDRDSYLPIDTVQLSGKVSDTGGKGNVLLLELWEGEDGLFPIIHTLTSFKAGRDGTFNLDLELNAEQSFNLQYKLAKNVGIMNATSTDLWSLLVQYKGVSMALGFQIDEVPFKIYAQTEKTSYAVGDVVKINGNVTRYREEVSIYLINPDGINLDFIKIPISSDREFNAEFTLKETRLTIPGTWTIRLTYGEDITTEITFSLGKASSSEESGKLDRPTVVTPEPAFNLYTSDEYGFSIKYPADWSVDDEIIQRDDGIGIVSFQPDPDTSQAIVGVVLLQDNVEYKNLEGKEYLNKLTEDFQRECGSACSDFKVLESKVITKGGLPVYVLSFAFTVMGPAGEPVVPFVLIKEIPIGDDAFRILFIGTSADRLAYEDIAKEMINSFELSNGFEGSAPLEESKEAPVTVAMKHKKKLTLVSVKNNGDEEISGVQIKMDDAKIRYVKARGWDRERIDQNTVIVHTDDKPIKPGKSLIIMLLVDNRTSPLKWIAVDLSGNMMAEGDVRPR